MATMMGPQLPQALAAQGWVDPYAQQRQQLMARLQAPQAPMYTPEQIEQRRAENQREYELGLLGTLSGNEQLGAVGGTVLKRALSMRDPRVNERGTIDQITGKFSYSPDFLRQRDEQEIANLDTRSAQSRQAYDAERRAFADRQELERQRAQDRKDLHGATRKLQDDSRVWRGEDSLRNDYDRLTKDLREEVGATGKITQIVGANAGRRPDAITQQSLVILLNKFLDPGSVVREGEFDRVVRAQGLQGRASNLRDYILAGEPLSAESIAQINGLANLYQQAAQTKMRRIASDYVRIAEQRGFDPANVITDGSLRGSDAQAPGAASGIDAPINVGDLLQPKPAVPGLQAVPLTGPNGPPRTVLPKATGRATPQAQPPGQKRVVQVGY